MKLGIVGSRNFNDYNLVSKKIRCWCNIEEIDLIVSGGAIGADSLAEVFAIKNNIKTLIIKPDWSCGKKAGYIRNKEIIENSDLVIAFWDSKSKGTKHTIDLCKQYTIDCVVVYI